MHTRIEIALADGQIKFSGRVETNLIVEGVNDYDVHHHVIAIVNDGAVIEVFAQTIEGVAIVSTEPDATVTTVKLVTVAADKREPVFRNDVVNPLEDSFFLKVLKSLIEVYQMLVAIYENRFLAVDVYADVATAAKKIKEAVDVLWK